MKTSAALLALTIMIASGRAAQRVVDDEFLSWTPQRAEAIGQQGYRRGRVGGIFDTRLLKTERSYNYKLAATWLSPEVIRATARLIQLRSRRSEQDAREMVQRAEQPGQTIVMVEIDPREGSGVIPRDWEAFLQPKDAAERAVRGQNSPELRDVPALAGVLRRNYDYDRFWVKFPLQLANGEPLFREGDMEAELVVRIHDKEGRVSWRIPESIRASGKPPTPPD